VRAQLSNQSKLVGPGRSAPSISGAASRSSAEADLLARLKLGDEAAANEFFDRYAARIKRFVAQSLGADAAEADDILQETFIALAEALPFFRGDSSLFTFACAIAHRKALSFIRTRARRARLVLASATPATDSHRVDAASRDFAAALDALRPEYREVLLLKYVEEIGVSEIARALSLSARAVESRLARARKALRKSLGESP
jgi:RNA polymerase sigma-70 factor (ECF subfamily)